MVVKIEKLAAADQHFQKWHILCHIEPQRAPNRANDWELILQEAERGNKFTAKGASPKKHSFGNAMASFENAIDMQNEKVLDCKTMAGYKVCFSRQKMGPTFPEAFTPRPSLKHNPQIQIDQNILNLKSPSPSCP